MQTALNANQGSQADTDFSGLWIPLVTPFDQDKVDYGLEAPGGALPGQRHRRAGGVRLHRRSGRPERRRAAEVLQTVMAEADGLPVIMGLSGYHLGKTAARVRALGALNLAGILLPAPSYIRPSQAGLIEWFTALADVPARCRWCFTTSLTARAADGT
jgi:4-hydroxy-tetrahydrodipicolinate synthase